jgi:penicillin-binding protein 1A
MHLTVTNPRSRNPLLVLVRLLLAAGLWAAPVGAAGVFGVYAWFARGLPALPDFEQFGDTQVSTLRAASGQPIGEIYDEKRYVVPFSRIPPVLVNAVLATEDASFFAHGGIDLKGIARAALQNLQAGHVVAGGSTITQQVAKSFLGAERSAKRKVREAIMARRLEDLYTKEQILTLYLNRIFFGHNAYGVQAAAQNYYRKNVEALSVAEAALLAGTIQSPGSRNPWRDFDGAWVRARHVLDRMVEVGSLDAAGRTAALAETVRVYPQQDTLAVGSPWLAQRVRASLDQDAPGWRERGVTAWTTADLWLQRRAEASLQRALEAIGHLQGYRGPLAHLDDADAVTRYEAAAKRYLALHPADGGDPFPARVLTVTPKQATFAAPGVEGSFDLAAASWAAPYTEFPRVTDADGHVARPPVERVSFKGTVKDLTTAVRPGDVVLVRRGVGPATKGGPGPSTRLGTSLPRWELADVPTPQGALLLLDPATGEVPALVGGRDFDQSEVDRTRALRQTGSLIKPALYALAYDLGLTPSTVFSGTPYREGTYNPDGPRGDDDLTAWAGLAKSKNNISLRVMRYVLDRVDAAGLNAWTHSLGLSHPLEGYISEVLGANETLDDMLNPTCTFWRGGDACPRRLLSYAVDETGAVLADARTFSSPFNRGVDTLFGLANETAPRGEPAVRPAIAELLTENLSEVVRTGTSTAAKVLEVPALGKTGTLPFDHWYVGAVDGLLTGVWLGADLHERYLGREKRKSGLFAAQDALPLWIDVTKGWLAARTNPTRAPRLLDELTYPKVDPASGLLDDEGGVAMPHLKGTEPVVKKQEQILEQFEGNLDQL